MANDFSSDSACKALWRFEPSALLADSVGGNTLSQIGDPGIDATSETGAGNYKEGSGSIKLIRDPDTGDQGYVGIADASLDAGFPLKSDDTVKKISFSGWVKAVADDGGYTYTAWFQKHHQTTAAHRCFRVGWKSDTGYMMLDVWDSAGTKQTLTFDAGIQFNQWYHFGVAIDGVAKTYLLRVYDQTADSAQTFSGSFTNELRVTAGSYRIGEYFDAYADEFAVFDDIKTASEFDDMRAGTYSAPFGGTLIVQGAYHSTYSPVIWQTELEVDGAYHVLYSDNTTVADPSTLSRLLPGLKISARSGNRISMPSSGLSLPGLKISARFASRADVLLPAMQIAASGSADTLLGLSRKLPALSLTGSSGARADSLKLPALTISATANTTIRATLDKKLAGLTISAFGAGQSTSRSNLYLPALEVLASASRENTGSLDKKLSALMLASTGSRENALWLDALLPSIGLVASGQATVMELDASLPALLVEAIMAAQGDISGSDRFAAYILRHSRW
jgi:hypothetical protein